VIVCDTAPLVAAALYRDPDHHRCVELFTGLRLANRQMVLPAPIVAEVGYLLGTRAGAEVEANFLVALSDFVPVELTTADYARMAELVKVQQQQAPPHPA
jgi:predicted nucleic acid-binding protein